MDVLNNSSSDIEISAAAIHAVMQSVDSDNDLPVISAVPQDAKKQYTSSLLNDFNHKTQLLGKKKRSSSSSSGSSSSGSSSGSSSSSNSSSSSEGSSSSSSTAQKPLKAKVQESQVKLKNASPAPKTKKEIKEPKDTVIAKDTRDVNVVDKETDITSKKIAAPKKLIEPSLVKNPLPKVRMSCLEKNLFLTERVLYPSRSTKKQKMAQAKDSSKIENLNGNNLN